MSKHESIPPERLRSGVGTELERRLLDAASIERPSPELSQRMARAIGVSLGAPGSPTSGSSVTDPTVVQGAGASGSLLPWISGALVGAGVIAGVLLATHSETKNAVPGAAPAVIFASAASSAVAPPVSTPREAAQATELQDVNGEPPVRAAAQPSARVRVGTAAGELANQIALVDAARSALAGGNAQRALAIVAEYQGAYPTGTFRPEVAAVKIEALVKMGRMTDARTLAERFVVAYGQGPLAARVARLAQIADP